MHIHCPTEVAYLMLGVRDANGLLRFPGDGDERNPGLRFAVKARLPIDEQLVAVAARALGEEAGLGVRLDIYQEFEDAMPLASGGEATLYLAEAVRLDKLPQGIESWPTLPELLKKMAKDRARLPYLRAWQVLTGGLKLSTKAVDVAELDPAKLRSLFET